ncbi:hypothetical protein PR048_030993 [Dryococelus australis]|uniref:ER membrane protein complex subunit 4 n=1 Tax=Dryococelus australis TaxID=614101 RepID=A0ABQ9G4U4_9NEOP|nr:hypothetical protein PR048_030993 [Dryococelus australis]
MLVDGARSELLLWTTFRRWEARCSPHLHLAWPPCSSLAVGIRCREGRCPFLAVLDFKIKLGQKEVPSSEFGLRVASWRKRSSDSIAAWRCDVTGRLGDVETVPMNLFFMYMAGNSISIFPIMMVGMFIMRPVKALFTIQNTFKMIEGSHAMGQKFVYLLGNVICVAVALYKCHSMGLLPLHTSDWLAFVEPQTRIEYSGGGLSFS